MRLKTSAVGVLASAARFAVPVSADAATTTPPSTSSCAAAGGFAQVQNGQTQLALLG